MGKTTSKHSKNIAKTEMREDKREQTEDKGRQWSKFKRKGDKDEQPHLSLPRARACSTHAFKKGKPIYGKHSHAFPVFPSHAFHEFPKLK